jgi:hypothetical protein
VRLADGSALRGDAVLLAVGPAEAARLAGSRGPRSDAAFESLRSGSALVLAAVTRADFAPHELAGMLVLHPRLVQIVARPELAELPDVEVTRLLLDSVPGLAAQSTETRLHRFPSHPSFRVGHYRALAKLGVTCAGDWTSAPHVEGELASGLAAARRLGLPS